MQSRKSTKLAIAASAVAIVQALIWMILCFLGILIYFQVLLVIGKRETHYELYTYSLFAIFAVQEVKMIVILFLYFLLSIMWISISASLIISTRRKQSSKIKTSFLIWGGWTLLICFFDIIVVGLMAKDYSTTLELYNTIPNASLIYLLLAYGTLFSLAARGYVLWVINLTLAIIIIKHAKGTKKKANYIDDSLNAFDEGRRGSFGRGGHSNQGFDWENNRPPFNHSNSYAGSSQGVYPKQQPYSAAPPKPYYNNDHVAKLGRHGPKAQAPNAPPKPPKPPSNYIYPGQQFPKIPSPDYSPPNSPLKSAMKIRQMQNPYNFNRSSNNRY